MPIYNVPLLFIDKKETRRYAGLQTAEFDEQRIDAACQEAQLLAHPQGSWESYAYDDKAQTVLSPHPFLIKGDKIGQHLVGADKVILLAATVGGEIEAAVTRHFAEGDYAYSVLLDAAATAAVEQVADGMEKAIYPHAAAQGFVMRWRFSPGYGDWSIMQQPEILRLSHGENIGIRLTESLMLSPRKSITAIIGLVKGKGTMHCLQEPSLHGCAACSKLDCPSRCK